MREDILHDNTEMLARYADILTNRPAFASKANLAELASALSMPPEEAAAYLMCEALGLDAASPRGGSCLKNTSARPLRSNALRHILTIPSHTFCAGPGRNAPPCPAGSPSPTRFCPPCPFSRPEISAFSPTAGQSSPSASLPGTSVIPPSGTAGGNG